MAGRDAFDTESASGAQLQNFGEAVVLIGRRHDLHCAIAGRQNDACGGGVEECSALHYESVEQVKDVIVRDQRVFEGHKSLDELILSSFDHRTSKLTMRSPMTQPAPEDQGGAPPNDTCPSPVWRAVYGTSAHCACHEALWL